MLKGILGYDSKIGGILTKGIDYICLILLWVAFSLPVITAGASTCAFFYAYNKAILHDNGYIWKSFWKSFKMNFKQTLGLWVIQTVLWITLSLNCFAAYWQIDILLSKTVMWILVGVSIVILTWSLFWLPYVARFEDKTWTVIKNTRIIMIQNLAWSFIILVLTVALGLFICAFFPIGMIGATAVYMAITGKIYYKVFRKYMTAEAIAEEDNDIIPI